MCGIVGIYGFGKHAEKARKTALKMSSCIRHRGPDWSGIYSDKDAVLAHERLSIVDPEHGAQPLIDTKTGAVLSVNGEIYNHVKLRDKLKKKHDWQTKSDCEVILYLYDEYGVEFLDMLNGIFAFILYDKKKKDFLVARDHIGICPLYIGWDSEGAVYAASEMKALVGHCIKMEEFPPGSYYLASQGKFVKWYRPVWEREMPLKGVPLKKLRKSLESAVKRQLMSDVPYGVLLSGGLDSSLIAAITAKFRKKRIESGGREEAWWPRLHSFSVGLSPESPDLIYARMVAKKIGTVHHELYFTPQEGIDSVRDIIYHLETFDVGTVRASIPMYLMARKIKAMGIKMVLSGEGSDEIFGGYLYFHKAPSSEEFHRETVRKLMRLSRFDCLRANKATAAWGLELRVPFLDKEFLDIAMSIAPSEKMCPGDTPEKAVLRKAFKGLIPDEVLWRQKEQLPDGVGYAWIDNLKKHAEDSVSDLELSRAKRLFPVSTPLTKEAFLYRKIFEEFFPSKSAVLTVPYGPTIACSTPEAFLWSKEFQGRSDPSGRAVKGVHAMAIVKV